MDFKNNLFTLVLRAYKSLCFHHYFIFFYLIIQDTLKRGDHLREVFVKPASTVHTLQSTCFLEYMCTLQTYIQNKYIL